jgi:CRP/FNR family transcriptional regulator
MSTEQRPYGVYDGVGELLEAAPGRQMGASPCAACPIRPLSICNSLATDELQHLTAIISQIRVDPGGPVIDEGEPADNLFNVTDGCVKVYKLLPDGRRQIIGFLFAGDFLGLAVTEVYAYSAEAVTESSLCRFPRRKLEDLMERFPRMERRLLGVASNELAIAQDQMLLLGRKTAKERLVTFLLMLSDRARERGQVSNPVSLPITRHDIGDYLGLTTETVSRSFTQLKSDGLIEPAPSNHVTMLDHDALREIAAGF